MHNIPTLLLHNTARDYTSRLLHLYDLPLSFLDNAATGPGGPSLSLYCLCKPRIEFLPLQPSSRRLHIITKYDLHEYHSTKATKEI